MHVISPGWISFYPYFPHSLPFLSTSSFITLPPSTHLSFPNPNPSVPPAPSVNALVVAGGGLAGLELLEVPVADLHVALVVVHALGEVLGGAGAVVAPLLLLLVLLGGGRLVLLRRRGLARAAAEHAADGMADRGADRYAAVRRLRVLVSFDVPIFFFFTSSFPSPSKEGGPTQRCWPSGQRGRGPEMPGEALGRWPSGTRAGRPERAHRSSRAGSAGPGEPERGTGRWGAGRSGRRIVDEPSWIRGGERVCVCVEKMCSSKGAVVVMSKNQEKCR